MVSHHCSSFQILTAYMAGKSLSDHHRRWFSAGICQPCRPGGSLHWRVCRWRQLGFQSSDPRSDLRTGILALLGILREDWNWIAGIAGIAGSISGISSRIWCCWNLKFSSRISCRIYTTETWMSPWNGVSYDPWDISRSWHDLGRSEVRLPGLHGGKVRRADQFGHLSCGLFSDPSHPSQLHSVGMCWWMLVRNICLYIPLPLLYQRYVWYVPFMIYFPISFSHKIPLDPITAQSIPMNSPLIIPLDTIDPDFCYDMV